LVEFAGRGGSADLGHTADLRTLNARKKCRADLLRICTQGRIYAADPLRGCPEICGSGHGADFVLKMDCGSVAGQPRNLRIWMRGGLYAKIRYAADPLRGCPEICGSGRGVDFMLRIGCGSVAGRPRNLRISTRGGLYAKIYCRSVVGLPRNLRIWPRGRLYAEDRLRIRCGAA